MRPDDPADAVRTPDVSLIRTLLERAATAPDRTYVVDLEARSLTYGETVARARAWAGAWRRAGVARGDHVVTMQHNTIEALLGWLGLAWLGAVEAPINTDYRGDLLVHALNLTRARTMLVMDRFLDRVAEVAGRLEHLETIVVVDGAARPCARFRMIGAEAFLAGAEAPSDLAVPAPWDIMNVLFTSGTTGPSKAVRLPWAQMHAMVAGSFRMEDFGPDEVIYNAGPTYHGGAKVFPYMAALCGGRHLMRPFISRSAAAAEYLRFGVTVGSVVHDWLAEPERADDAERPLKFLLTPYRDPAAEPFARRFGCRRFGVFNMTEVSCPIRFRDWDAVVHDAAGRMSCGVLRDGYQARVVDEHDQPVPDGQAGELILRADRPWVMNAGYLNNPEATAEAWRNGWFHTGDAVYKDADGNYFFLDRMKDAIRRRGENISSFEVEAYVNAHPAVALSAAVAVKKADHAGADEEIKVVVQCVPGQSVSAEELVRWLIPRMPRFMVPRYVEFIDALPLTPTQKVRKKVLRESGVGPQAWDREAAGIEVPR
ncbi:AMP-binding protein [Phenylobacterium sp.]|uniref:AMP-binding protein n=1 Tax=Phenylobacterium sp. TaxID=1871053 RepID=UPI0025F7F566|nr:AMP-binding protein [Phenylobacterium sp.]MBX3481994.1 AMP-binding protein [Phenylobacterium sp.]MCW5758827.1 AMP-binding protein [Phenylobacterium sp.]